MKTTETEIFPDRRIIRVYDIIDTFRQEHIEDQIAHLRQKLGPIRDDTLARKVNENFREITPQTILATLAQLRYGLKLETPTEYFGTVRSSQLLLDTREAELKHTIEWENKGGKIEAPQPEKTLSYLLRIANHADNKFATAQELSRALRHIGLTGGQTWFTGILDVNGKPARTDITIETNAGKIKFEYIAHYKY